jgi:hypothetical protein
MTTPFSARDAALSGAIERTFGEQFTFSAVQDAANGDVNLPKVADPSKPAFTCVGVWEALSDQNYPMARGSNPDDMAVRRSVQFPSVSVDASLLQWMPVRHCLCTRVFNGAVYEIERAAPDDMGRVLFTLTARKKP